VGVEHDEGTVLRDEGGTFMQGNGEATDGIMHNNGRGGDGKGLPGEERVEAGLVGVGGRVGGCAHRTVEGRSGKEEGAPEGIDREGNVAYDHDLEGAQIEDELRTEAGGRVDVEDRVGHRAEGVRLSGVAVSPTRLARVTQHGRDVEDLKGEGLGAGAVVGIGQVGVGGRAMVVLEDGAPLHEAPSRGADAGATGVEGGATVDAAPSVLGAVLGLGVRGDRTKSQAWVEVKVGGERGSVDRVPVVLAHGLGGEIAADDAKLATGNVGLDPEAQFLDVLDQGRRVLATAIGGEGEAGALFGEEAAVGAAVEVLGS
jgi:hypothetical protein